MSEFPEAGRTARTNIGIAGLKHSGKTTLSYELMKHDRNEIKLALADPLKDSAVSMLNDFLLRNQIDRAPFTREDIERDKPHFRPFLEWLGTEFAREYVGPDSFWLDRFLAMTRVFEECGYSVICDDVRFPNEAETLRANGFFIVKLIRDEDARQASLLLSGEKPSTHASETEIENIIPDLTVRDSGADAACQIRFAMGSSACLEGAVVGY